MIKTTSQLIAQLESENCVYALRYENVTNEIRDAFLSAHRGINYGLDELRNDERKRNKFAFHYNGDKSGVYAKRMLNLMEK